ncbi:hypothetical protein TRFO_33129 [Tritrichomonas foetus]|uniref:Uncharacterized protein n=1 Tax=Tritrichomonas foetus TaxID=1144522 RepID=A0A1J4JNE1_9EUKA|nr:hypothetical protein TRFO_33129 [Tritrichomonas foetus]|eukprot:OHT00218.1 hypothetical protein TRFO_33129 [Tritrichomonas foetus]
MKSKSKSKSSVMTVKANTSKSPRNSSLQSTSELPKKKKPNHPNAKSPNGSSNNGQKLSSIFQPYDQKIWKLIENDKKSGTSHEVFVWLSECNPEEYYSKNEAKNQPKFLMTIFSSDSSKSDILFNFYIDNDRTVDPESINLKDICAFEFTLKEKKL